MAAPNLLSPSLIVGKTAGVLLSTTNSTTVIENVAASGKVFKINSVYAANVDGSNSVNLSFSFYDASATTSYKFANQMAISVGSCIALIEKTGPIYLEEGDKLTAQASAASDVEIIVSYEEIS